MQKQVLHNQTLVDIAIQYNGFASNAFELAYNNELSITSELMPGQNIEVSQSTSIDADVVNYFLSKKQTIATGFGGAKEQDLIPQFGIGTLAIGTTFIVE